VVGMATDFQGPDTLFPTTGELFRVKTTIIATLCGFSEVHCVWFIIEAACCENGEKKLFSLKPSFLVTKHYFMKNARYWNC
jgi:hypothetical protein